MPKLDSIPTIIEEDVLIESAWGSAKKVDDERKTSEEKLDNFCCSEMASTC